MEMQPKSGHQQSRVWSRRVWIMQFPMDDVHSFQSPSQAVYKGELMQMYNIFESVLFFHHW